MSVSTMNGSASAASSARWIQLVLGLVAMMSISSPQYVWTLFTKSFQDNLHTTLPAIQITFSILIVLQTWLSPVQGCLVEKLGPKLLIGLGALLSEIERSKFAFPQNVTDVVDAALAKTGAGYPDLFRDLFKYLHKIEDRGAKPNREAQMVGRFAKTHSTAQSALQKSGVPVKDGRISCVFPPGGIQDNTVNRLLLMSSSERHLSSVPMAFFIEELADEILIGGKGPLSP